MRVIVLLGGDSAERDVSRVSGRSVAAALQRRGHQVLAVDTIGGKLVDFEGSNRIGAEPPGDALVPVGEALHAVERISSQAFGEVDVIFVALHGTGGEDGTIQGLLELAGLAYTGSGVMASSLAMDKEMSKRVFHDLGVPTPAGFVTLATTAPEEFARRIERECGFPAVIKPNAQGSSVGVSIIQETAEIAAAVEAASEYDDRLVCEEFIPGREMTVAIFDNRALPVVEIVPQAGLYDYRAKYTPGSSEYHVPAEIPENVAVRMQDLALQVFQGLRCRDFARVDFRLRTDNEPFCLEVNTIPGMTASSLVPKAAHAAGIDFDTLVERIVQLAAERIRAGARSPSSPGS